jgi:2-oxoglutarate dehydrogenase E2 component (dihydrolipoamide succinyltransferase)
VADFANRARDGKIKIEDLQGGTFTISNGGFTARSWHADS